LSDGPLSNISTIRKESIVSRGVGTVRINVMLQSRIKLIKINERIVRARVEKHLLSVPAITEKNYEVKFTESKAYVIRPNKSLVCIAIKRNYMYVIKQVANHEAFGVQEKHDLNLKLWHYRYDHLNYNDLKELVHKKRVYALDDYIDEKSKVTMQNTM